MMKLIVRPEVEDGIKSLQRYADSIQIKTSDDASFAGTKLYQLSELKKIVEDQRTEFTKPLNLSLRSINAFFKKFSTPLDVIDSQIRTKVAEFGKESQETVFGNIHLRKNTVIEIIDEAKVPREYLSVDMAKVKLAIANGKTIEGILVKEEKTVSL